MQKYLVYDEKKTWWINLIKIEELINAISMWQQVQW
jgi:hypothetical protein